MKKNGLQFHETYIKDQAIAKQTKFGQIQHSLPIQGCQKLKNGNVSFILYKYNDNLI